MSENEAQTDSQAPGALKRKGCRGYLLWVGIIAGMVALLLCLLAGLTWARGNRAKAVLAAKYPPPGQMVDVGGYQLHINCRGRSKPGVPTVVLLAGAGEFSLTWDNVQRHVASFAHVCAYDRAGLGWSERGPNPRTAPYVVGELDALLETAGVEPPYVLVGHSMGGLYARLYAHEHPDRVVGMVLVDAAHEETNQRLPEALVKANARAQALLRIPQAVNALGLMALDPGDSPAGFLPPRAPGTDEAYFAIIAASPDYWSTALEESAAAEDTYAIARSLPDHSLGDLPMVVISAGVFPDTAVINLSAEEEAQVMAVQSELQADLVTLSSAGEQVIAEDAGHYVHLDQPEPVIDAIQRVLDAAQQ
jgi:pimeloyl-ACP methyl ester carboxylesterase